MQVHTTASELLPFPEHTTLRGLWLPLVTPFAPDGAPDLPALARLVRHYKPCGLAGLVVCGSTGEAAALDADEQLAVLEAVLHAAKGWPVVMGVPGNHLGRATAWVQRLAAYPLAGLLVSAPPYIRPSQTGLLTWFNTLADAAHAPLVLYDIPYRTGAHIDTHTLLTLAEHPNIQAIKDCGGDMAKTQALVAQGRLQVLAGDEASLLPTLAMGGAGAILAAAHLATERFVQLVSAAAHGRVDEAHALWRTLRPLVDGVYTEPNPAALKWALAEQGLIRNVLRAPMTRLSTAGEIALAGVLSRP